MVNRLKIEISPWYWDALLLICFLGVTGFALFHSLLVPNVLLEQGLSHRIFYFHVPVAWVALYGPFFASLFAIFYLFRKNSLYDRLSFSLNQVSLVFAIGVLISGPIWAKSAWGVPWDWTDARLQSFFILCLSLAGYFLLRSLIINPQKKELIGSYLTILCAMNALLTWGAIRWFDNPGNHPGSVLGKGGMDPDMQFSFYWNVLGYHILFLLLIRIAFRLQKLKSLSEESKSLWDE
jgi:heme exporter protein C